MFQVYSLTTEMLDIMQKSIRSSNLNLNINFQKSDLVWFPTVNWNLFEINVLHNVICRISQSPLRPSPL